jgi:hypothetical protein
MNSPNSGGTRQRTRRVILEAMVDVIMETDGIGFSVQAVADRAGVTHRTIYGRGTLSATRSRTTSTGCWGQAPD